MMIEEARKDHKFTLRESSKEEALNFYKKNSESVDVKRQVFKLIAKKDKNCIFLCAGSFYLAGEVLNLN